MLKTLFFSLKTKINHIISNSPSWVYTPARYLVNLFDWLNINTAYLTNKPFLIVYQQGRVASTAVFETLDRLHLPYKLFHVHYLNEKNIEEAKVIATGGVVHRHFFVGKTLGNRIRHSLSDKQPNRPPWRFVTIIREPVSLLLSTIFINGDKTFESLSKNDDLDQDAVLERVQKIFIEDDIEGWSILKWFELEFKQSLGISVYDFPVDNGGNFFILQTPDYEILVLKFEHLQQAFTDGTTSLLQLDQSSCLSLPHSNPHRSDKYKDIQRYVNKNICLPVEVLGKIYSSEYVKHFYSEQEISALIKKWSGDRR